MQISRAVACLLYQRRLFDLSSFGCNMCDLSQPTLQPVHAHDTTHLVGVERSEDKAALFAVGEQINDGDCTANIV